jgi:zinc D-Ala-D-Ala carboxypeptidase
MAIDEKNLLNVNPGNITNNPFGDPTGIYPKQQYATMHAPDVNVLASVRGGGHPSQDVKPIMSTPVALDPKQPTSARQAVGTPSLVTDGQYPYKKVEETESGHTIVKSDVPGAEVLQFMHRTGTYTEYRPDGSFVTAIQGKGYYAVADDNTIIVKGTCKIVVEGDCDMSVGGDYNLNVRGNWNCTVGGDARINVQGSMGEEVHGPKVEVYGKELSQVVAGDHTQVVAGNQDVGVSGNYAHVAKGTADIASTGNMTVTSQGTQSVSSKGNQTVSTQGAQTVASKGNQSINSQGTQTLASSGNQTVSSAGTQKLAASGAQTISSEASQGVVAPTTTINGASVKIGGGSVLINGNIDITGTPKATPAPVSWGAGSGSVSGGTAASVEPPTAPEAPTEKKLPESQEIIDEFTNWTQTEGIIGGDFSIDGMYEMEDDLGTLPANVVSTAIKRGIVSAWPEPGEYITAPGSVGSASGTSFSSYDRLGNAHNNVFNAPTAAPAMITPDTSSVSTSGSFKLSKYFTLAQLTASEMGGPVRAQYGQSAEQIVTNLMYLATNVLDPVYDKVGGKMRISSGFRSRIPKGSSGGSQHNIGQAADIQFPDMGADQYYHVAQWIRDNLDYDQLIFETTSHSMWVHVSYKPSGNRRSCFSMHNHKTIGQGIVARTIKGDRVPKKSV